MDIKELHVFKNKIIEVIPMLEMQYKITPIAILELIIKRYKNALYIIEHNDMNSLTRSQFTILGGVRAYLDSTSDYLNPILGEMNKAEDLLEQIFKDAVK